MGRREFLFDDGSSKKFWAIEVEGSSQTVHFGRAGTTGQAQTKAFASEAEANKASDKLIAEKVKKGYAEVLTGTKSTGTPTPTVKTKKAEDESKGEKPKVKSAKGPKEPEAEMAKAVAPGPTSVPAIAEVTRTIDLEPEDIQNAEWPRKWRPKVRPEPRPFNLDQCVESLSKIGVNEYEIWDRDWEKKYVPDSMTGKEAHFWLLASIHEPKGNSKTKPKPDAIAKKLSKEKFKDRLTVDEVVEFFRGKDYYTRSRYYTPFAFLLTPKDFLTLILHDWKDAHGNHFNSSLLESFADDMLPYLEEKEILGLQKLLRSKLKPDAWVIENYYGDQNCDFAAYLGMHDEVLAGIRTIDEVKPEYRSNPHLRLWIQSLGKPEWIESEARRFKILWKEPKEVRHWLATTQFSGFDLVRDSILDAETTYDNSSGSYKHLTAKEQAERLTVEFARVKAPEAAPYMLELKLSSKAPAVARQWLDEQIGNAIAGLMPTAAGRGKLAEAAIEYLREAKRKGHEKLIRACLEGSPPEVAESIKRNILDFAEKEYSVLDAKSMPAKLKSAFDSKAKKGKLPSWTSSTALPPIIVAEKKLGDEQVIAVLEALQRSTLDKIDPLIPVIKEHADANALDAFGWKLFQLWQSEGYPPKEKWAMTSLGLLGGDASALKITPLIRNWPGESQHQRAVFGLNCLRTIGSDMALMQLNGIAQKLKFKGLKQKAAEAMEAIATDKGLTRAQLEDRIVPDCDLDKRGSRVFDFGPRQFRFVLGPEMKPMIKDAEGKVKTDLPKPGAKDDATKAEAAVNDWKLMKKQIKEVANIQALRLEQAMVTGRRWPVADFETLLVQHPLMTNLVRLILWGGYDKKGKLAATFRVTEDRAFADVKDNEFKLKDLDAIGIVHPLHLSAQEQSAWGEVFSDYEIVPPFRQLGRRIVRLEKSEEKDKELNRWAKIKIPPQTLVFGLEKLGWTRGVPQDAGVFYEHTKTFPGANVTAVVQYDEGVPVGYMEGWQEVDISRAFFLPGIYTPKMYPDHKNRVELGTIDHVAVSEVLTDLSALAAKGK